MRALNQSTSILRKYLLGFFLILALGVALAVIVTALQQPLAMQWRSQVIGRR